MFKGGDMAGVLWSTKPECQRAPRDDLLNSFGPWILLVPVGSVPNTACLFVESSLWEIGKQQPNVDFLILTVLKKKSK